MTRPAADNTKALDAFLVAKAEIHVMLERLAALSADHFEISPDEVNRGHIGTLNHYCAKLREITDMVPGKEPETPRADLGPRVDPDPDSGVQRESGQASVVSGCPGRWP